MSAQAERDGRRVSGTGLPKDRVLILRLLAIADGVLLISGLWTPIAGSLVIGFAIWQTVLHQENPYPGILLASIGAALALVGPGALSMDAWLFGWKRIDIGN